MADPEELYSSLREELGTVLVGQEAIIERLTIALLIRGHVLLEGVPGIAKTTTATLFADALGLSNSRIQLTPDVLPADITGTTVYRMETGEFDLQRGPVFANLVIADEINRATPKTQSALLEAMGERQVTIGGDTMALPSPFMVIATQNPIEMEGTFELPEAQRDRFQLKLIMDLPNRDDEAELLHRFDSQPELNAEGIEQVTDPDELASIRETVSSVYVSPDIHEYILDLVGATRSHADILHGASPRASLAFLNGGKARAAIHGRDYVIPEDVKSLAPAVLAHRLVLTTEAELSDLSPRDVVAQVVSEVEPPSGDEPIDVDSETDASDAGDRDGSDASDRNGSESTETEAVTPTEAGAGESVTDD